MVRRLRPGRAAQGDPEAGARYGSAPLILQQGQVSTMLASSSLCLLLLLVAPCEERFERDCDLSEIEVLEVHVSRAFPTPLYRGVFCIVARTSCRLGPDPGASIAETGDAARLLGTEPTPATSVAGHRAAPIR
jgi:hypothetical protein